MSETFKLIAALPRTKDVALKLATVNYGELYVKMTNKMFLASEKIKLSMSMAHGIAFCIITDKFPVQCGPYETALLERIKDDLYRKIL